MQEAVELELLMAECSNYQGKEAERIQCLQRATEMFLGIRVWALYQLPVSPVQEDSHTSLQKLIPYLLKMLSVMTTNENQPVKIAAVKGLEFLLEVLGCTLDNYMIDILKTLFSIYPVEIQTTQPCFESAFGSLIQSVLERYVSVLSSISSHILHQIFYCLLVKSIQDTSQAIDLRHQMIKIAEKIIAICQGDISLNRQNLDSLI